MRLNGTDYCAVKEVSAFSNSIELNGILNSHSKVCSTLNKAK